MTNCHQIDSVPPGAVIFIAAPPHLPNGLWSSLVAARGHARGAAGAIIDGRMRELAEHREQLGAAFPVFARDSGMAPPHELVKVVAIDVPVKLASEEQDMTVRPGDYLVADLNGVVVVPKETVDEVVGLARKHRQTNAKMMVEIKKGMSLEDANKKFRS